MKLRLILNRSILAVLFFLLGITSLVSQTLNKPTPADNPNQPGFSIWSAACASENFNEYFVDFTWNTPLVNNNNTFILELSDANGSFDSPIELATDNTKNTTFSFNFSFDLPTTTRGEGYRMRVRSTGPALTGIQSDPFPMYYIDFNSPLLISPNGSGNIPSGGTLEICDGNTITLAAHNIPNANTYQYNWYRSGTLLTEKGPSLTVSQAGMYHVELDYGSICSGSANTLSNDITVTVGTSLGIAINTPSKTALCAGETVDLVTNITGQGLTYTWLKDGVALTTPTVDLDTYTVDTSVAGFEGNYQVEIVGIGTCLERSAGIPITNAGDFIVTRNNEAALVLLPGGSNTLSVTSSASGVTYQWFRNGTALPGATTNTLNTNQIGTYYAQITLSEGACTTTFKNSEATEIASPSSFQITINYLTPYTACSNTNIALGVTTINAVLANGSTINATADLLPSFVYQWRKDGIAVTGATSQNISLTEIVDNGNYTLEGTLNSFNPISNALPVQLLINEILTISSTSLTTCNTSDPITISTTTNLTGETFDWFYNGTNLNATTTQLNITAPGTYRLLISKNGCPLNSNDLVISELDPSLITLDSPPTVIFPEGGSRTVTANGGTAYRWYNSNNELVSSTSSINLQEEGAYLLIANIDACEITRQITASLLDTFKVPNVITVNGDGVNDLWILPNTYSRNPEINVTIYNDKGVEVFNQFDYQNNWPQSSTAFPKQNMVFFYKIRNAREVLKQGTITVIR